MLYAVLCYRVWISEENEASIMKYDLSQEVIVMKTISSLFAHIPHASWLAPHTSPSYLHPHVGLFLPVSRFPFVSFRNLARFSPKFQIYPSPGPMTSPISSWIHPDPDVADDDDLFDRLPDSVILLIFNKITDVKALGRCCVVSRRFHTLVPQVDTVLVRVDCVISDDDSGAGGSSGAGVDKPRTTSSFFRLLLVGFIKPFQALGQLIGPGPRPRPVNPDDPSQLLPGAAVTHHSPSQVLKNFSEIRSLRIELPSGELGIDDGVLLKWRAHFGSTLDACVILGAASSSSASAPVAEDNGSIPESFYTNGGLKMRVVWTISSLIAASARHYLLQPIISEHRTVESLVLTDGDGQGVLCMNRDQLEELRVKPLSASSASKRTLVPALNMRLWYASHLELPGGMVLKGATLVAIRPSEVVSRKDGGGAASSDLGWISSAFEEPYGAAARMLVKRRTYCLEMNSF